MNPPKREVDIHEQKKLQIKALVCIICKVAYRESEYPQRVALHVVQVKASKTPALGTLKYYLLSKREWER